MSIDSAIMATCNESLGGHLALRVDEIVFVISELSFGRALGMH